MRVSSGAVTLVFAVSAHVVTALKRSSAPETLPRNFHVDIMKDLKLLGIQLPDKPAACDLHALPDNRDRIGRIDLSPFLHPV